MYSGAGTKTAKTVAEYQAEGFPAKVAQFMADHPPPPPPPVEVWPVNWPAFKLFDVLATQWRVGGAGPIGLDYGVLYHKLDRMRLDPDSYDELEADIMVMERAALEVMSERRN